MSGYVEKQKWRPLTGSINDITYISASIHDGNEIPTAITMFLGSGNKTITSQTARNVDLEGIKDGAYLLSVNVRYL